jgi:hypothetical protein
LLSYIVLGDIKTWHFYSCRDISTLQPCLAIVVFPEKTTFLSSGRIEDADSVEFVELLAYFAI